MMKKILLHLMVLVILILAATIMFIIGDKIVYHMMVITPSNSHLFRYGFGNTLLLVGVLCGFAYAGYVLLLAVIRPKNIYLEIALSLISWAIVVMGLASMGGTFNDRYVIKNLLVFLMCAVGAPLLRRVIQDLFFVSLGGENKR